MTEKKFDIRIARPEDRSTVVDLFLKLLRFLDQFEHDMLPTQENADTMADLILMPAAKEGDPILIAWDGAQPAGALFWAVQKLPYAARWTTAYGYGTYIEEAYRSQRLGTLLRTQGIKILKDKKIQRLMTMVLLKNEISVKASDKMGWEPFARIELTDIQLLSKKFSL